MKKYAIITINKKPLPGGYPYETRYSRRRVLIEYTSYEDREDQYMDVYLTRYYMGTRIVEVDDYFKDPASSHKYTFYDDGYILDSIIVDADKSYINSLKGVKREYHYCFKFGDPSDFEFEAPDDDAAKLIFVLRKTEEEKEEN